MFMFDSPQDEIDESPEDILAELENRVEWGIDNLIKELVKLNPMPSQEPWLIERLFLKKDLMHLWKCLTRSNLILENSDFKPN